MSTKRTEKHHHNFLNSAGEIGKLIQQQEWITSDIGKPEDWPQSLCTALSIVINTPIPTLLFWGPKQICFYNSSYLSLQKSQTAFSTQIGKSGNLIFSQNWDFINPIFKKILKGETLCQKENYFIPKENQDTQNESSWNFNYSPVYDESGAPKAVLVSCLQVLIDSENKIFQNNYKETVDKKEAEIVAIIENSMFPIAVIKVENMEILRANKVILNIWGKGENVIGKKYSDVLPELEVQEIFKYFHRVAQTGNTFSALNQKVELVKNGEPVSRYFNYSFAPLKDEYGKVYAVLNTAVDITEVTEARMKEENTVKDLKLFKFMADNAADKLILIRKDASFAYVNNRVLNKWGYTKNEVKQLNVFDVDTLYNKRDFDKLFEKSFENNSIQFETTHKNKAGEVFPVEVSSSGIILDEEPFIFVIARDITERKKTELELRKAFVEIEYSEKRFKESVKQAPLGIAIFKGENFIAELVNSEYYKLIDRTEEQFLNRPLFEAIPEVKETIEPIFKEIFKTGKPFHSNEFPAYIKRKNGLELSYFNLMYHPLREENGNFSGIMVVAIDITETVIAKKKLQESERQFKNMIMQSPVAITILRGEEFILETANKVMLEKIMVRGKNEVIGNPLLSLFPELANQEYPAILREVFEKGENRTIEEAALFLNKNESNRPLLVNVSFTAMPATDITAAGIMVTINDVTDKVEARKNVEDSNERLRMATEAAEMGTWELDLLNKGLLHSPQLSIIFGEAPENKFDFDQLRNKFLKMDLETIVKPALKKAKETGVYFYEARILKNDKNIHWIKTQGKVLFNEQQQPIKMMGTTMDITEEKLFTEKLEKSEERFRLLANEVPQLIWTADADGKIVYYNESVFNYSGLEREVLYNDGWINIVHPDDRKENERLWTQSIISGSDFLFEHRFRRFDGSYRWQLSRAIPQRNEHGKIQAWVGSSTDIQDIKEQEQQKDFFISMASHELKTPVTSIKGYVQILQSLYEKSDDVFLKNSLQVVGRQIITLTKLISELLDISKIKSSGLEITKEDVDIPELIREVAQQVLHTSPQYTIELDLIPAAKLVADKDRIGQVLINLFTNAIKYSPNAKNIAVSCKLENDFIIISIKDEGIGISKLNQEKIFERFYRVEGKDEKTYPGFGIGLFIASEIIKKHNGTMQVESELGKGSIFSFSLPLNK